jgi:UDP-glucose 4-epimerase
MRLLVCGGAGYIGSHMCKLLAESGHEVTVLDNLSTGHREAAQWGTLHVGDISDAPFLAEVFSRSRPDGVLHFAAKSLVAESVAKPSDYWFNNVVATLNLLEHVRQTPGCVFVFSSTASIFGNPRSATIDESHPRDPINAYGRSKLAIELVLQDYWQAYRLPSVSFRYFNAAGADASGRIGELHQPETHLIPRILESMLGRAETLKVFGDDYDTSDGTCVRDYVHVTDLCQAHLLGLEYLHRDPGAHFFNLGNGAGFSVREVLSVAQQVIGRPVPHAIAARRPGDPARLVAHADKARRVLGWNPQQAALDAIIESAWRWHSDRKF